MWLIVLLESRSTSHQGFASSPVWLTEPSKKLPSVFPSLASLARPLLGPEGLQHNGDDSLDGLPMAMFRSGTGDVLIVVGLGEAFGVTSTTIWKPFGRSNNPAINTSVTAMTDTATAIVAI